VSEDNDAGETIATRELSMLVLNTYLLRLLPFAEHSKLRISGAPYPTHRAQELSEVLASYDVAALSEVFNARDVQTLCQADPHFRTRRGACSGPPAGAGRFTSSGLITLSKRPVVRTATHRFMNRGSILHDPDAYAAKGVALTEINLGADRNLEVFSTHLIAGNDLIPRQTVLRNPDHLSEVRLAQMREVLLFVDEYHRPNNATLVVGDFNIEADSLDGKTLAVAMGESGFEDLWDSDARGVGPTVHLEERPEFFITDPGDERFFADLVDPGPVFDAPPPRIDFAFWRSGGPGITVEGVRRRALPRAGDADGRDVIGWMSDHAGLHLDLSVN